MEEELKTRQHNEVSESVDLSERLKPIYCKWVFNTKKDSKGELINKKRKTCC